MRIMNKFITALEYAGLYGSLRLSRSYRISKHLKIIVLISTLTTLQK